MNFHGGDIHNYSSDILDFSSNVNPFGVPDNFAKALMANISEFTRYPDTQYTVARENIARYLGVDDIRHIVVGNGAVELLYACIGHPNCEKVVVAGPAFSEYERAAKIYDKAFSAASAFSKDYMELNLEPLLKQAGKGTIVIVCNPNNPTGTFTSEEALTGALTILKEKGAYLLVDETFIEFTDGWEDATMVRRVDDFDNLIVVRAVTKFFGMPGIRLGYMVTSSEDFASGVPESLTPWHVNTAAVIAAESVFSDNEYISKTKSWIGEERRYVFDKLNEIKGINAYPSSANYHLVKLDAGNMDAWKLKEEMLKKGILIRTPDGFGQLGPCHFRLALKDRASNDKMLQCLREVVSCKFQE